MNVAPGRRRTSVLVLRLSLEREAKEVILLGPPNILRLAVLHPPRNNVAQASGKGGIGTSES